MQLSKLSGRVVILAATIAATPLSGAWAQSAPEPIVTARQAGYDLMSAGVGLMKAGVAAGTPVKGYSDLAEAIVKWGKAIPTLFPPGSGTGTKAKPEVWNDRPAFEKAAQNLVDKATVLVAAAKADDVAAFKTAFGETAAACGACHKVYREK